MRVLIVDDNATNLTLFKHLLKKVDNVETECFDDPLQAIVWCHENTPDLVLLDYMMPMMDGLEFIQHFRTIPGHTEVPLIMVTADTESDVRYRALEMGAHDFLTKPVDKVELTARVRNLLTLRKTQIQLANRSQWLAQEVKKATQEIALREKEAVFRLSKAAEYRDPETGAHLLRMANYSYLIAKRLNLPEAECELVLEAAPMQDIGKVATPDHILLKRGKLTDEEFIIMKQHSQTGYEILADSVSPLLREAAMLALTHHEKFNGMGYPRGLKGEDIPLHGRIIAVADVFDALTSVRPYKPAWPLEEAVTFLQNESGSHFDPICVSAFLAEWENVILIRERYKDDDAINVYQL